MEDKPAIRKLRSYILQIGIAHVIHGEHKEVVIFLDAFLDIGEQSSSLFLVGLLRSLGLVDDLGALGERHCGGSCLSLS